MLFIENKYTKIYFSIIASAQSRAPIIGYVEEHHIIPKSLGGSNHKENLVKLTAREHFICHWLLTKMVLSRNDQFKVCKAFLCMSYLINSNHERYRIYGRAFENIRNNCSTRFSEQMLGDKNPMYGKTHTEHARKKISNSKIGKTPWNKGITHSDDVKRKISNSKIGKNPWNKGITHSAETKAKLSAAGKNRAPISDETKAKLSYAGKNRTPISEETRAKMVASAKKRVFQIVVCQYCGLSGKGGNMSRWHGDKCKMKPNLS